MIGCQANPSQSKIMRGVGADVGDAVRADAEGDDLQFAGLAQAPLTAGGPTFEGFVSHCRTSVKGSALPKPYSTPPPSPRGWEEGAERCTTLGYGW
ncbi:hypothetical protein GCM10010336_61150 [Streptomyces goshikiensis]|nr:hypothetical protein GCM10010336_61150 [Streptomyces goshikiensis]